MKGLVASLIWAGGFLAVTVLMTGCSGAALYMEAGAKRVDEYQSSQRTYARPIPLKCYVWSFEGCNGQQAPVHNGGMVEGS